MKNYYANKLSAERLQLCYELAPSRVLRYFDAEIGFVNNHIKTNNSLLELGCGYGRVFHMLSSKLKCIYGIDISYSNLLLAQKMLSHKKNIYLTQMNSIKLGFPDQQFDMVICIQNGISAFKVDKADLIKEALRVTKTNGLVLFSSYSDEFWEHRLEWFQIQADNKLIGDIDYNATSKGVIACNDGFISRTVTKEEFITLCSHLAYNPKIIEVENSSVFCVLKKLT